MNVLKLLFILTLTTPDCSNTEKIRMLYHQIKNKEDLEHFIKETKKESCNKLVPYLASAIMQTAEYTFFPTKKLKNFNQGKKRLEAFIEKNPTNIEARYIRILIQSEIPKFLGYHKNKETDIQFIKLRIDDSNLPNDYKKLILQNISEIK